ncbi:LADA_0H03026g1_1 [Lachancea dasiensis]|uniref:cysteine--tRNA ligase n=1 Tax=Lachancea dasiensis TaxID=1072105 RepID=A0A1G4K017_9SACH|nr:LADA_0H03026g1_1 [Lachancea dasiensis]
MPICYKRSLLQHCWKVGKRTVSNMSSNLAGSKGVQPPWQKPSSIGQQPVLKLYNSMTRNKEEFLPISGGKYVTWYSCGPTVYDSSHMGHARNYVSIDINRRIMQDYFGFNVEFVQNVTDIDDKIIIRARQNYVYERFVTENPSVTSEIREKGRLAAFKYIRNNLKQEFSTVDQYTSWFDALDVPKERESNPKFGMHTMCVQNAFDALKCGDDSDSFYQKIKDVLTPVLDEEFGGGLNDPEIFRKLPAYWEREFNKDMAALNVLPPTITTRVSEYVPEIVEFVKKIVDNGYAYAAKDGSVYFDTAKFDKSDKHEYAKCQPWNKGQLDLINDAEGSLSDFSSFNGKRSPNDFALWKASKPGEPEWESPWGKGRPGWHIECSVMASDVLGSNIDIHTGGIDLAFPHHDNELAQSEACFDNYQWVNYFLHTGHLHIEGQKMSKSLKNFITINEALSKFSSRQLRLTFCSAQWNNQLDFKESLLVEVKSLEQTFNNFFKNVRAMNTDIIHKEASGDYVSKKFGMKERELVNDLKVYQNKVHEAFCDNLSTPVALKALSELVTRANLYVTSAGSSLKIEPLVAVVRYVTKIIDVLGFPIRQDGLGWLDEGSASQKAHGNREELLMPYVKCLSNFRDEVRRLAIEKADNSSFLKLTDKIRDQEILDLNISIDDRNDQASLVKFLSDEEKAEYKKLIAEKDLRIKGKEAKKLEQSRLREAKEAERRKKAEVSPEQMFLNQELYSEWDQNGLPLKNKDGSDVTKSMLKKLKKQWDAQKKLHDEFFG